MPNPEHLKILKQGVEVWNAWRRVDSSFDPDLKGAELNGVNLDGVILIHAHLEGANISGSSLRKSALQGAHLEGVRLWQVDLSGAVMDGAHLEKAVLIDIYLKGAQLWQVDLRGTQLYGIHLEGADLNGAQLGGADLYDSFLDNATKLDNVTLFDEKDGSISLRDVHWGDVNLSVVDWTPLKALGNDQLACQKKTPNGGVKDKVKRIAEYREAVRNNRQLSVVLRDQGLDEEAARFAYRAQKLQRVILWRQKKFLLYIFSLLLDLLAGFGYRPGRSVLWYPAVIFGFALAYHFLGGLSLYPPDAFVFSIMSFHGRGFFPSLNGETNLHNPLVILAAFEAVVGLLIEISFIATFTQRFFGR